MVQNDNTQPKTNEEKQAALAASLGDLAGLANTPKPPPQLSRQQQRQLAHEKALAEAAVMGPRKAEKVDVVITPQGAIPANAGFSVHETSQADFDAAAEILASGGEPGRASAGPAPGQVVPIDEVGRPMTAEPTELFDGGDVVRITTALIQQHGARAIKALRHALVIICDEPALRSQIEREMRVVPAMSTDDISALLAARQAEMNGRVAVVIPSFNYARFVTQAIDSVLAQTTPPDEIIVVDDASTDETVARLAPYVVAGKIRLIQHGKNSGTVGATRNTGIAATDAEFVVCLDADDMLKPEYLETCMAAIKGRHEVGVVYVGVESLRESNGQRVVHEGWPPPFSWSFMAQRKIPANNCIPTASLFRREMWLRAGGYDDGMPSTEDVEFWIRALGTGFEAVKCSDRPLFVYRRHGTSMSNRPQSDVGAWNPNFNGFKPLAAPLDGAPQPILRNYTNPAVTVIIPCGPGHQKYLRTALQSLQAQTARDFEVVIINDTGSPLSVPGHPYALVFDENGGGVARARNRGVAEAKAPLVFFLDADDYIHPDTLRIVCQAYAEAGGGYVYTGWTMVHEDGTKKPFKAGPYDRMEFLKPGSKGLHGVSCLISKADFLDVGGFDPDVPWFEDMEFWARCAAKGVCGVRVEDALLFYRAHTGDRRKSATMQANKDAYAALIDKKYGAILRGEEVATKCCGARPDPLAASQHMGQARGATAQAASIAGPGETLMVYVGRPINAPSGKFRGLYRGWTGMPPIPVKNGDVDFMLSTTQWVKAAAPPMPTDNAHIPMNV